MQEGKKSVELRPVQLIAKMYYARPDIANALLEFCRHRETVPRYLQGFGKRPDCFEYVTDFLIAAQKGATSFHCSEELWSDPMRINTNFTPEQYNEIKIGWDFLIDIDSKYLDYSKIAAKLMLRALHEHGVDHVGIKFSGSKGFHLIVPFDSFPVQIDGTDTKDMFPQWARYLAEYLQEYIAEELNNEIFRISRPEDLEKKGYSVRENLCPQCGKPTKKKKIGRYVCENFRCKSEVKSMKSNRKQMICPSCNGIMPRVDFDEVFFCDSCKVNSAELEGKIGTVTGGSSYSASLAAQDIEFTEYASAHEAIDSVDVVLVASRHLFRAPYSLHEKTALASIVLSEDELEDFEPAMADPLKITVVRNFMPRVNQGEASELLRKAMDFVRRKRPAQTETVSEPKYTGEAIDVSGLAIDEGMFPPIITKILKGIESDGRKRALFVLLSFFSGLEMPRDYIVEKIAVWNKKNKVPLQQGYVNGQIDWFGRRKILPPNYDKPIYKEFGGISASEQGIKNPINYTIKRALRAKGRGG